jgi:hypothetical protein
MSRNVLINLVRLVNASGSQNILKQKVLTPFVCCDCVSKVCESSTQDVRAQEIVMQQR